MDKAQALIASPLTAKVVSMIASSVATGGLLALKKYYGDKDRETGEKTKILISKKNSKRKQKVFLKLPWCVSENIVGKGRFGCVYKGTAVYANGEEHPVAVKTMNDVKESVEALDEFTKEALLMSDLDHENIVPLIGVCCEEFAEACIIMPFMSNGNLLTHIKNTTNPETHQFLSVDKLVDFIRKIASGMSYLADKRIVHRDLRARNCLLDDNFVVKVSDFGLAKKLYKECDYYRMSDPNGPKPYRWTALESLREDKFTSKSDVWSFGIVMWEILTRGWIPYPAFENCDLYGYLQKGGRLEQPRECTDKLYGIMRMCWEEEPDRRPTFSCLVEMLE